MENFNQRGKDVEGWAFTFCKAAFLAVLCGRYAAFVLPVATVILYIAAYAMGVREWRCWVKPPWVVIVFAAAALYEGFRTFR